MWIGRRHPMRLLPTHWRRPRRRYPVPLAGFLDAHQLPQIVPHRCGLTDRRLSCTVGRVALVARRLVRTSAPYETNPIRPPWLTPRPPSTMQDGWKTHGRRPEDTQFPPVRPGYPSVLSGLTMTPGSAAAPCPASRTSSSTRSSTAKPALSPEAHSDRIRRQPRAPG